MRNSVDQNTEQQHAGDVADIAVFDVVEYVLGKMQRTDEEAGGETDACSHDGVEQERRRGTRIIT
ncbi:MAG TPA: hypothetical protein VFW28_00145 [Micropepsaceae bacterium]|nr:hypothetical protein [Micropepsaceae bacterium]